MALTNPFDGITITQSDVLNYYPALSDHLELAEGTDIDNEINQALCQFWDDLKDQFRGIYNDSKLADLRDFEKSKPIERKISYMVVATVLVNHGEPEMGQHFKEKADAVMITDLAFSDDVLVSKDEKEGKGLRQIQFGR